MVRAPQEVVERSSNTLLPSVLLVPRPPPTAKWDDVSSCDFCAMVRAPSDETTADKTGCALEVPPTSLCLKSQAPLGVHAAFCSFDAWKAIIDVTRLSKQGTPDRIEEV